MSRRPNPYNRAITVLQELHKSYPNYGIGRHIATALSDYGDLWGITDKEFVFALEKYQIELEFNLAPDIEIAKIIKDAENLDTILNEENEEDDDDY
jgi:hypothetical protein